MNINSQLSILEEMMDSAMHTSNPMLSDPSTDINGTTLIVMCFLYNFMTKLLYGGNECMNNSITFSNTDNKMVSYSKCLKNYSLEKE